MIRFDPESGGLHCALDDLLDAPPGSHASAFGPERSFEAALDWHGTTLRVEVPVSCLRRTRGGCVAEFERCVAGDAESVRDREIERAGLASALLQQAGEPVLRARIHLRAADGRTLDRIDLTCARAPWSERLAARIAIRLEPGLAASRRTQARAAFAETLRFPFDGARPGQELLLREIESAAHGGLVLLCSAPTGLGKTAAALYPLLRFGLREDRVLFFATAKVSQQQLALDTLRQMLPPGAPAHAVQIAARQRICPAGTHGCTAFAAEPGHAARCSLRRDFAARLERSRLAEELAGRGVIDAAGLAERALAARLCPFETSLALAREASAIVGDFNYVFDPHARLELLAQLERPPLLIVDEAHNLAERARGYFSPALALAELERLAHALRPLRARAYRGARSLFEDSAAHLRAQILRLGEERGEPAPWPETPDRSFWEKIGDRTATLGVEYALQVGSERARPEALRALLRPDDPAPRDPVTGALQALGDFARCTALDPDRSACIFRPEGARIVCLDASAWLAPLWRGFHAVVCMSATLAPFEFHRQVLGLESPRTEQLDLPSPFPARNRLLLAVNSVDTTWRRRDDEAGEIAALIARCTAVRPGNYLAFFPSFAYRDAVVSKLPAGRPRVLLQLPGLPAEVILKQLARKRGETLLVAGVQGGVLAEGVDYPGELAVGVFVVGPGLPAVTLEQELIRSYYERELGQGFDFAYLFPGLARAVQSGGRALRTPEDRAAILLLCRRFSEPTYRDLLPAWWREELIDVGDPLPALRAFWGPEAREC